MSPATYVATASLKKHEVVTIAIYILVMRFVLRVIPLMLVE